MKNHVSVLRTTTAIMVSLSLAGTHAMAAGGEIGGTKIASPADAADGIRLAQAATLAGSPEEIRERIETEVDDAVTAVEEGRLEEARQALEQARRDYDLALRSGLQLDPSLLQFGGDVESALEALGAGDAMVARAALDRALASLDGSAFGEASAEQEVQVQAEATQEAEAQAAQEAEAQAAQEAAAQAAQEAEAQAAQQTEAQATQEAAAQAAQEAEARAAEARAAQNLEEQAAQEAAAQAAREVEAQAAQEVEAQAAQQAEAEAQATQEAEAEAQATQEDDEEVVEQVTEEEVEEATSAGQDVVVEETTTVEELQVQLEELRQQQTDLESMLSGTASVEAEEEVVTDETARSATEEVIVREDDDNNVWKYLGAAAAGAAVGALVPALGGRLVQDSGDRMIVERGGEFFVRHDENALLRQSGTTVQSEEFPNGITRTTFIREDGSRIVTIRNEGGFILRRTRITPEGEEIVLLEQTPEEVYSFSEWDDRLPEPTVHRSEVVDYRAADSEELRLALVAQPSWEADRSFPLQAVRENQRVRELVPAIDLPINFALGSAAIRRSEIDELAQLGRMMSDVIDENPREIFLVEGHTDATGSNLLNLALSDRRAEAVALALTEYFDVPPENLVVQGYGERYLKEPTQGPSEVNRRATVRRITPLIDRVASR